MANPSRNSQYGYMTEKMLERLQQPKYIPIATEPQIADITHDKLEQENFWDKKPTPFSMADGNWKKTLEHIFSNTYNYVKDDEELRESFGSKKFGRQRTMIQNLQFLEYNQQPTSELENKKPPTRKRVRTPREEDKPIRQPERRPKPNTPPQTSPRTSPLPVEQPNESMHDDHKPKVYTEETVQQGTLIPFQNFNAEQDCEALRKAVKGLGTNESMLIHILGNRSVEQRLKVKDTYKIALLQGKRPDSNEINEDDVQNDARRLYDAGEKKWGTDESQFIQILCNQSDVQLRAVFDAYGQFSKKDIEAAIKSETSGSLRKSLLAIVRVMRNRPGYFAYQLKKALKGLGTDEEALNRIIISRCEVDMIQIKEEYSQIGKRTLENHVQSDTSGDYRKLLLELLKDPNQRTANIGDAGKTGDLTLPGYEQPLVYNEEIIQQGTMVPYPNFDANRDAEALRKAMKGMGTDEKTLINILGNRVTAQRLQIKDAFKSKFGRDLTKDLIDETSGNFKKLLERLMLDPVELDCFELRQAVKGIGTDEETLIEILASRSNARLKAINDMYPKTLEKDVSSDTSGSFRRLLVALLQGRRPETIEVNIEQAKQDAQTLVDAGEQKFGTDESRFNVLFCDRSDSQFRAIINEFTKLTGKTIGTHCSTLNSILK
ncbi:unnamed protein product, partial [Didymodactylos carnosus]